MSCFIGLSTFVCCTVLSCSIGMLCNVFKALEIQRDLTDRTVSFYTAELTVLRRSTISSVLHVSNWQFCVCYRAGS